MYKVTYGGKDGDTINLVESPDMVVIRTKNNAKLESVEVSEDSRQILEDTKTVAEFPEAGVSVRRVEASNHTEALEKRDDARATLKKEENIRFAGRVLQNAENGQVMLYTENFFVKFEDKLPEANCKAILEKYQLSIKSTVVFAENAYFVSANEGTGLQIFEIADKLLQEAGVEFCHPELVQERKFKVVHPLQWHLAPTSVNGNPVNAHVNIADAWKTTRGEGITIAVIDDGVDVDHPEFQGRIVEPFDATLNISDPRPKNEDDMHGTACAGMACAAGLENGASGTAPASNLMPIRLRSGLGSMAEANAFAWAAIHGADVISCSWGPSDGEWWNERDETHTRMTALPDSTRLAFEFALKKGREGKGCVILFAAGNGNEDVMFDGYASYPGVIAVAACNDRGSRSVYSDYGDAVWVSFPSNDFGHHPFQHPAPLTPGLRTTDRVREAGYTGGNYTNTFGGTSGACPGMAGVVALMLSVNPDLTPVAVKNIIRKSCTRIDAVHGEYNPEGHSKYYGYGRINAALAIQHARANQSSDQTPGIEGSVRFSAIGDLPVMPDALIGNIVPVKKVLGFQLRLRNAPAGLSLRYRVNVPGEGLVQNSAEDQYVGAESGRKRIIGFSLELLGPQASAYHLEYSARLRGQNQLIHAANGEFCGSLGETGRTIDAVLFRLTKKDA